MRYPDTVNLPFNAAVLGDSFEMLHPGITDDGAPGIWAILRGGSLVAAVQADRLVLPRGTLPDGIVAESEPVLIARWQGLPVRAIRIGSRAELPPHLAAEPFNAGDERLDDTTLTLGGIAQQVLHWDRSSARCPRCGGATERLAGGWGKHCPSCRTEHFPHIHPCAIILVRRGDEFLLVRKPEWAPGRYSLVAGFLDFGESLEECARREVREEAGVEITDIRYVGSQSWPFPSQLMAGFVAEYAGGEIRVDPDEIEDGRWFSADRMPGSLPHHRSIARWIIERFALGDRETP